MEKESLKETIYRLWKEAFKAKNVIEKEAYESIKTRILNVEKSGKAEEIMSDETVEKLIEKEIKEMKETQTYYKPEDEMYQKLELKIKTLSKFLPEQMSEDDVVKIINQLRETESNKGKLIGLVIKKVGNKFDRSKVAMLVNRCLN